MAKGFQAMTDMAKSPSEIKRDMPMAVAERVTAPVYPWGLCITLDQDDMAKLDLGDDLPQVGEMIHMAAMAKVTSVSEDEREGTDGTKERCCRVSLQITHLATENEDDEVEMAVQKSASRRKRFYGDAEDAA